MKFKEAYKLICEDKIDQLLGNIEASVDDVHFFRSIYNTIYTADKTHNKFSNFFKWFMIKYIDNKNENFFNIFPDASEIYDNAKTFSNTFNAYLKYNLKLENFKTFTELYEYIEDKENQAKFIIDEKLAKKIYEDDKKIVIMPLNYKGSEKYGSSTWCIQRDESAWKNYLADGKLSHFVLYKSPKKIEIPEFNGKNWNIANVQVDLYGKFYITNAENTVGGGMTDANADKILQFMKLDKSIFKSLKDKEILKTILDNNDFLNTVNENSHIYEIIMAHKGIKVKSIKKWFNAIDNVNIDEIKEILQDPEFDPNVKNNENYTALIYTCKYNGNADVIKLLLSDPRIDVNIFNSMGCTAFYFAANMNRFETVKLFIADGRCDMNISNTNGDTPFQMAVYRGYSEIVKLLLNTPGVDINKPERSGTTPLLMSIRESKLGIMKILLENPNIDVNAQNKYGKTALMYICEKGYAQIEYLQELLKRPDVDLTIRDDENRNGYDYLDLQDSGNNPDIEKKKELIDEYKKKYNK